MECLIGYIGLSQKFNVQPAESGLYVDTLPDISLNDFEKLTDETEETGTLWDEIQLRAAYKFRTMFIREVNKCHKVTDIAKCECLICQNKALLAVAMWYLLGAEVQHSRETNSRQNTYTVLDHSKAKELRDYFESQFEKELEIAVRGIDIHGSSCFDKEAVDCKNTITFATPIL